MRSRLALLSLLIFASPGLWAASGTEGASFLDIPVGAGPAALGAAYTAQANDVYAPVWNPATPEGVTETMLDTIFAALPADEAWQPLRL